MFTSMRTIIMNHFGKVKHKLGKYLIIKIVIILQVGTSQKTYLNVLLEKFCLLLNVLIKFSSSVRHVEGDHIRPLIFGRWFIQFPYTNCYLMNVNGPPTKYMCPRSVYVEIVGLRL